MLTAVPTIVTNNDVSAARARLRASRAELEEARAAHRQEPSVLTRMEVDFWTTTVRRDARAVEKAELASGAESGDALLARGFAQGDGRGE